MLPEITIDPNWYQARGGKTPWNPSKTATARVPLDNHLPPPEVCPYCGSACTVKHHEQVYGMVYGDWPWMYSCTGCDARVGMHPFTSIPLGSLADGTLRRQRIKAKEAWTEFTWRIIDRKSSVKPRTQAYQWLARQLRIDVSDCHFGRFDLDTCDAVVAICNSERK